MCVIEIPLEIFYCVKAELCGGNPTFYQAEVLNSLLHTNILYLSTNQTIRSVH